ncbi:MAG TPA: SRPBCC family protein [Polyangiaceae bacterium]|nr:SRPBCC family protein [Polyangiaceae bacterium]
MPEVEYTTFVNLPPEKVWDFVKDMNNWAPFLTGYQKHEILNETDSVWTLKGDVGVLARTVELKAHITEWSGPERVSFTLAGVNELVDGGGTLLMGPYTPPVGGATPVVKRRSFFQRLLDAVFRFFFRRMNGPAPERQARALPTANGSASKLQFVLRMDAGGPSGPLVNAMLGPALLPAAEDLANKIAAHLERAHGAP